MGSSRLRLAPPAVSTTPLAGGGLLLASPLPLAPPARCVGDWLEAWAERAGDRPFLVESSEAGERRVSYREARAAARAIGQALLDLGLGPRRPLLLLSDNSVDHALLQLGAMHAAVPAAPVSPAYALVSEDLGKLRDIAARLDPGALFAADRTAYGRAIAAVQSSLPAAVPLVHADAGAAASAAPVTRSVAELCATPPGAALERAFAAIDGDTVAKILFTSGSTGWPKGVVNPQRMLCVNQQQIAQLWPFLDDQPPVVVDWLPWSHTFGGNHNFNLVLRSGGTLHIDHGKPAPAAIGPTLALLRRVSPTMYFNVPRGFDVLLPYLEADPALRESFFRRLDVLFYAAAALPQPLWERLSRLAEQAGGAGMTFLSAWGSTETAPLATSVHFAIERAGVIGLPAPGIELKLAPVGDKLEMRVKGPNVTPGYWEAGGLVRPPPLDDQGFLPTGDAGRLDDPARPERGLVFEGRLAENFKLSSGTWVSVGALRLALIAACTPLLQDAAVTGHDLDSLGVLIFPSLPACRERCGAEGAALAPAALLAHPEVRRALREGLLHHNRAHPASSTRIARALLMVEPPSIDGGEITDKGYLNQRAVLTRRGALVARLHAAAPDDEVLVIE